MVFGNIANKIYRFTIHYGKFILILIIPEVFLKYKHATKSGNKEILLRKCNVSEHLKLSDFTKNKTSKMN